jgi:putative drug exporter of the RND superfamily
VPWWRGTPSTARLVTSAAPILLIAFIALSTVPSVDTRILATALALGIAIDVVVVRALPAPALVAVLWPASWTQPTWLARLLRSDAQGAYPGRHRAGVPTVAGTHISESTGA